MPFDPEISLLAINPAETKVLFHKDIMYVDLLQHVFYCNQSEYSSIGEQLNYLSISTSWNITWPLKRISLKLNQITWEGFPQASEWEKQLREKYA